MDSGTQQHNTNPCNLSAFLVR